MEFWLHFRWLVSFRLRDVNHDLRFVYCEPFSVSLDRSRREISMPSHLTAWKSTLACPLYVNSRCDEFTQFIPKFVIPDGDAESLESSKSFSEGLEPLTAFRSAVVATYAFPGPLNCSVLALTTQRPSGDRDSADHTITESLQPNTKRQLTTKMSEMDL
jgi:hypothetical protein